MNDTRLWEWQANIADLMLQFRAFSNEGIKSPADRMAVQSGLKRLADFHRIIVELMPAGWLCLDYNSLGSCCYRQRDHEGPHLSEWGHTWTDESDQIAAAAIAKSMEGQRD